MKKPNIQNNHQQLKNKIQLDIKKIKKAKKEKLTLLAQTVYLGTLGFIFILPVIIGGYLGVWLDNKLEKYFSISWTISLICLGIIIGAANVYFFMKGK
ncbi:MAG: AtpZ/AtpI family protein [Gammaproteobacteria bacterium]|jgi:ATP synthase protein I